MTDYLKSRIKTLQGDISGKYSQISAIEKDIDTLQEELDKITSSECMHKKIQKIHASSGIYCVQTIRCEDCEIVLAQKSGYSLFHPKDADIIHARGN